MSGGKFETGAEGYFTGLSILLEPALGDGRFLPECEPRFSSWAIFVISLREEISGSFEFSLFD